MELIYQQHAEIERLGRIYPLPRMTLREWYAGLAMQAVIIEGINQSLEPSEIASDAFNYADAMIAESKRRGSHE